jgi:hypothetical protein
VNNRISFSSRLHGSLETADSNAIRDKHRPAKAVPGPFGRICYVGRIASAEPVGWSVYTICEQSHWTGAKVEGPDEAAAMERAAAEFKVPATKLMAIRR